MTRDTGLSTSAKGSVAPVLASLLVHYWGVQHERRLTGSLNNIWEKGVGEDPKSQDLGLKNAGAMERRARDNWGSVKKGRLKVASFQMRMTPFQAMRKCKGLS